MPANHAARTPPPHSPALSIALGIGILGLLLLIVPWPGKNGDAHDDRASAPASKATGDENVPTAAADSPAGSAHDAPEDTADVTRRPVKNAAPDAANVAVDPAAPAVALAADGTPLWRTKRADAGASMLSDETEYERQTRIWREGAKSGRDSRVSGRPPQSPLLLAETAGEIFPGDHVGQLLWQLGYEWGYLVAPNVF